MSLETLTVAEAEAEQLSAGENARLMLGPGDRFGWQRLGVMHVPSLWTSHRIVHSWPDLWTSPMVS
jgi:hypothetical protein